MLEAERMRGKDRREKLGPRPTQQPPRLPNATTLQPIHPLTHFPTCPFSHISNTSAHTHRRTNTPPLKQAREQNHVRTLNHTTSHTRAHTHTTTHARTHAPLHELEDGEVSVGQASGAQAHEHRGGVPGAFASQVRAHKTLTNSYFECITIILSV